MTNYLEYDGDEELLKVNTDVNSIKVFIKSTLHSDYQREIDIRINSLTSMLDDPKMQYTGRDYDVFRGGKRAMLELKNIFIDIMEGLTEVKKEEKSNE